MPEESDFNLHYLPLDCPQCDRRRVEPDGICEKCHADIRWHHLAPLADLKHVASERDRLRLGLRDLHWMASQHTGPFAEAVCRRVAEALSEATTGSHAPDQEVPGQTRAASLGSSHEGEA